MHSEEFIRSILQKAEEQKLDYQQRLPLGLDDEGNLALARTYDGPMMYRNTCVTGENRSLFVRRFITTLSCLYEKDEACFFVLSPDVEYGELLKLNHLDITVPYLREKSDLAEAKTTLKDLLSMRETGKGYPKLFVVLDGLETLPECNEDGDLQEYREIFDLCFRRENVEIITAADLMQSIFSGSPGAFVGVGNCLVSIREEGSADVTYVGMDVTLSKPAPIHFPTAPSMAETIAYLNSIGRDF